MISVSKSIFPFNYGKKIVRFGFYSLANFTQIKTKKEDASSFIP